MHTHFYKLYSNSILFQKVTQIMSIKMCAFFFTTPSIEYYNFNTLKYI